jgi:hypothetical protein
MHRNKRSEKPQFCRGPFLNAAARACRSEMKAVCAQKIKAESEFCHRLIKQKGIRFFGFLLSLSAIPAKTDPK